MEGQPRENADGVRRLQATLSLWFDHTTSLPPLEEKSFSESVQMKY